MRVHVSCGPPGAGVHLLMVAAAGSFTELLHAEEGCLQEPVS